MQISKIIIILFVITIALAPIYWFFLIPPMLLSIIKVILLSMLLFFAFAYALLSRNILKYMIENRNINYLFLVIMLFMLIGVFTRNDHYLFSIKGNEYNMLLYSFILAYLAYFVTYICQINNIDGFQILVWPAVFIVIVSVIHIGIVVANYEIITPFPFGKFFEYTSFGTQRTGWSNQISLFAIILPTYVKLKRGSNMTILLSFVIGSLPIIYSQMLTGGRSGFLTSIFLVIIFMLYFLPKRYFITIASVILIASLTGWLDGLNADFKRGPTQKTFVDITEPITYGMVNQLSSKRLEHYKYAINVIEDNPFLGVGIGNARVISQDPTVNQLEIHNVFLRIAAESGLLLPIVLFYPFLYALVRLRRLYKIRGSWRFMRIFVGSDINKYMFNIFVSSIIVVSGLIIALLEPRHIYGGMSGSWIWWVSLSILVFNCKMLSYRKSNDSAGIIDNVSRAHTLE